MEKELRNPPAKEICWSFYHRPTETRLQAIARTAWLAVKSYKLSFQECDNFVESAAL